jgi:hypothetical protein
MSAWRRGRAYSQDLRDRVLAADGVGSGKVAGRYDVSSSYVVKVRQRRDRLGEETRREHSGRIRRRSWQDTTMPSRRRWRGSPT